MDERQVRSNRPVPVLIVDGVTYAVRPLSIAESDVWLERVDGVLEAEAAVQRAVTLNDRAKARTARQEYQRLLADCVFGYDEKALPREQIESRVSWGQMVAAFTRLQEITDPFVAAQTEKLALLDKLPAGVLNRAISSIPVATD